MNFKTVAQATSDLEALAKQLGASRFDAGKKAYLANNIVTDDNGSPLAEFDIPVTVEKAAEPAEDFTKQSSSLIDTIRKSVREEIEKAAPATSKALRIEAGGDDRRKSIPRGKSRYIKEAETAYKFGRWIQATAFGDKCPSAVKFCKENGLVSPYGYFDDEKDQFVKTLTTTHSEGTNADGGFLVPLEFEPDLLWLREKYGVFRQYAQVKTMTSDRKEWLRKDQSHTAYFAGENATSTASKMGFVRLGLTAKKLRVDGFLTEELSEDAAINVGDEAARDIAEAMALKEDQCGFNGDGTSTYGGITGLTRKFLALGTVSNSLGIYDSNASSTGATYDAITLAGIMAWRAKLPAYADNERTRIFCTKLFYHAALERLSASQGGMTLVDMGTGMATPMFMGTPVVFCQALPGSLTADVPDAFYGDLSLCATFGDRRGITFKTSDVAADAWENDAIAYKATQRFDINVHDVGNNTANAADRKAGPVVALIVG